MFQHYHVSHRQNVHADALASLATSLAFPAGVVGRLLIYSHDMYCLKLFLEDELISAGNLQVKEALGT